MFSTDFSKNANISNFMKIRSVSAELFHPDGRTDGRTNEHDEASSRLRNFANATPGKLESLGDPNCSVI